MTPTTVDLDRLRALYANMLTATGKAGIAAYEDWCEDRDRHSPALFDELEAARAEVEQLKQHRGCPCQKCQDNGAGKERAAIVAWLRENIRWHGLLLVVSSLTHPADMIERGEHHADPVTK